MGIVKSLSKVGKVNTVVVEQETDIFEELMKTEQDVTLFCLNYFYTGKITAVNGTVVVLEGARIVYETGSFNDSGFKRAEKICAPQWFVAKGMIESFGILEKK